MQNIFIRTRMWERLTPVFLDEVRQQFHYRQEDTNILLQVAGDIRSCIKEQEGMEFVIGENAADVAISLGANLDVLLEKYAKQGKLLEQLAAENIISVLMLKAYDDVKTFLEEKTGRLVCGYHFWGSEDTFPLEEIRRKVHQLSGLKLSCTREYQLRPSKSVVFSVELKEDKDTSERPEGEIRLCQSCELGRSGRCSQRQIKDEVLQ